MTDHARTPEAVTKRTERQDAVTQAGATEPAFRDQFTRRVEETSR